MNVRHLRAADFRRQPWKNGGGFTTELAVFPAAPTEGGVDGNPFLFRLSLAEIAQSGPFSDFDGYERTIMLVEGDGMELSFDARPSHRMDARYQPFVFDGAWRTDCTLLGGPVRDLNLMVLRDGASGTMEVIRTTQRSVIPAADQALLYVLEGLLTLGSTEAAPGELLWIESGAPVSIGGRAIAAQVCIRMAP